MARQSISFTQLNDEWLKTQVDNKEYSSKSELVNDLIRQARKQQLQLDWVRYKLEKAEKLPENILTKTLLAPNKQIKENLGGKLIVGKNIIEPTKVERCAVENACEIASMILTN